MALLQAEPLATYIPVTALLVLGAWRLCSAVADTVTVIVHLVRGARRLLVARGRHAGAS
jgi:hypothetical protein